MEQKRIPENVQVHSQENLSNQASGYETFVKPDQDGLSTIDVLVKGVHCGGCIQKIESRLAQNTNIKKARLNFTTGKLSIAWEGKPDKADEYTDTVEKLGYKVEPYDPHSEKEALDAQERFLLVCLGVAGFAMGNIMLLSVALWTTDAESMGMATRSLFHWISGLIAIPAIAYAGRPFFNSALKALRAGHTNMDVPISLALTLACAMSVHETVMHGEHAYFDSAVMLMFFLLIGRYLDFRARKQARSTANDLLSSFSGFANVIESSGKSRRVPIRDLREDMIVRVSAGEKFPVDSIVLDGRSEVDTSLVTGETMPRPINPDSEVYAGTLNLSAPVTVRVAKAAEDSLLSEIVRLMDKAGQGQAQYVRLADRAAKLYTPVVHTLAAASFLGWLLIGGLAWQSSLMIAITVLIITCPCALGLAVPVVQVLATGKLMKAGILVKSGDALERLAGIDTILLDKTGTITLGELHLVGTYDRDKMKTAAALASHSTHPLSRALVKAYEGNIDNVENVQEHPGKGLEASIDGKTVKLGSRSYCGDTNAETSKDIELWLKEEDSAPYVFRFSDRIREDSKETIEGFQRLGLATTMVTGDRKDVALSVAKETGIETVYAEQTPPQKFDIMEALKNDGKKVAMIGDGLNDAPVLAAADVSIAPGSAIDMAQNAADIVFMGDKFAPVLEAYETACYSQKLVKQNFMLAVGYNIIAIPLALAGMVTPMVAAVAMSGSSLIVVGNSFRLKLKKTGKA